MKRTSLVWRGDEALGADQLGVLKRLAWPAGIHRRQNAGHHRADTAIEAAWGRPS